MTKTLRDLTTLLAIGLLPMLGAGALSAQGTPAMTGFEPFSDLLLEVAGQAEPDAEIYASRQAAAYLVMAPELALPVLIRPGLQQVQSVDLMKVVKRDDGSVDLLAGATLGVLGTFEIQGQAVVFSVGGKATRLVPRPPLVGEHPSKDIFGYSPDYGRGAAAYFPTESYLEALRAIAKPVRVRVYFGTWCPHCQRLVPNVLRVQQELEGSKVSFEFYGLPRQIRDDPEAVRVGIESIPTAIVFVDGKETGRLTGGQLMSPEAALSRMLEGQS